MKLRIRGNSIRIRVTQFELDEIAMHGEVRETVDFGDSRLTYALARDAFANEPSASLRENVITLRLPAGTVQEWVDTNLVSIHATQRLDNGGELQLLVEKDFACLEPRPGEDESDMFPHPEAAEKPC